jgi:hypothetical protein
MSSMHPSGKFTAEPTSMIVFALLVKVRRGCERREDLHIHGSPNMLDVHLTGVRIDRDVVDLDTKVFSGLVKSGMCRCRNDPTGLIRIWKSKGLYTYISGSVMPFTSRAHSRCVLQDMRIDSVPPDVVVPAPLGLLYLR